MKYSNNSKTISHATSAAIFTLAVILALPASLATAFAADKNAEKAKPGRKPNIILIMADDLGWGDTGVYGADKRKISTPHINRVFVEGRRYFNAYAPSAVCSPTRFGVLTGAYPWRNHRVPRHLTAGETFVFKEGEKTIATLLKEAGYATACFGKWHLGAQRGKAIDWNKPLSPGPKEAGFDTFFGVINSHNQAPFVWVDNDKVFGRRAGEDIEIKGNREELKGIQFKRSTPQIAGTLVQRARQFIDDHKDKPFFLYYPACTVHSPLEPASFMKEKSGTGAYGDSVQEFDWQVGRILSKLSEHRLHTDTLLIVTSDNGGVVRHGEKYGHKTNGHLRGQKAGIYEGGVRVPFIARWPGTIPPATDSRELVSLVDFVATACAAAGVDLPEDAAPDSLNLLSEMTGKTLKAAREKRQREPDPIREAVIAASKFDNHLAIRQGPWKLIAVREPAGDDPLAPYKPGAFGPDKPELYHLDTDGAEANNVYDKRPDVAEKLGALLKKIENQGFSRPGFQPREASESVAK